MNQASKWISLKNPAKGITKNAEKRMSEEWVWLSMFRLKKVMEFGMQP